MNRLGLKEPIIQAKPWQLLLAAVLSGGGLSVAMPFVAPDLYRSDPFSGTEGARLEAEIRTVKDDVAELRSIVTKFMISGPIEVRNSLDRIEILLDSMRNDLSRHELSLQALVRNSEQHGDNHK